MSAPEQPRLPVIGFAALAFTFFLGAFGTFGAFLYMSYFSGDDSKTGTTIILAVNGFVCGVLVILCALSAWRLFRQKASAKGFARKVWFVAIAFTLWVLLFDGSQGWSPGGIFEVVVWSILEVVVGVGLLRKQKTQG